MHPLTVKNILTWMYELYTSHQWFLIEIQNNAFQANLYSWFQHTKLGASPEGFLIQSPSACRYWHSTIACIQKYTVLHEWCLCHTNLYPTITWNVWLLTLILLLWYIICVSAGGTSSTTKGRSCILHVHHSLQWQVLLECFRLHQH